MIYNKKDRTYLINAIIGQLTVLNKADKLYWNCICSCGTRILIKESQLVYKKKTTSCGCAQKAKAALNSTCLEGKIFNRLIVIEKTDTRDKYRHVIWKCKCSCGNIINVPTSRLRSGITGSCGCLKRETTAITSKKASKEYRISKGLDPEKTIGNQRIKLDDRFRKSKTKLLVKQRDNNLCVLCNLPYEHIHHIIPVKENKELACELTNVVCLCKVCHTLAHKDGCRKPVNQEIQNKLVAYIESIQ